MPFWRKVDRLRPLDEAAAYARCHGDRDESVRVLRLPPRRARYDLLATGEEIRRRFEANPRGATAGLDAAHEASFLVDQLIRCLYDYAMEKAYPLANPTSAEKLTLAAVGGYGRGELAPFSDIDLLFLLPYKLTPHSEQVVEFMLYRLWDLGLKVGHAARTVQDCIIKPKIKTVPGVAGVDSIGGYIKQFHVHPEPDKLIAFGVTPGRIAGAAFQI